MSSIVSLKYGYNGTSYVDTSIRAGIAVPAGQPGQMVLGSDGTNTRYIRVTAAGEIVVEGPLTDAQLRASAVPVSIASLPLPSGSATAANQVTGNNSLSSIDTKTPALVGGRVPVDGSGVTQPVSIAASVTVTGPLTDAQLRAAPVPTSIAGVSTAANQGLQLTELTSINSVTAAQYTLLSETIMPSGTGSGLAARSVLIGGQYKAAPPTYNDGDQVPLAVTSQGYLRTQVTGTVSIEDFPDVQEVSGFVYTPGLTDEQLRASPLDVNLPPDASTATLQSAGNDILTVISANTPALVSGRVPVDGSGVTQPVSGPLTDAQLRASPVPVGLPSGASTSALQNTGNASLASIDSKLTSPNVTVSEVEAGLSRLMNMLAAIPIAVDPASGRIRVVLDPLGGAQTLGTVTTVSSVTSMTTLTTLTNQAQIGGFQANSLILDAMASSWANQIRGRIV